MKLLTVIRLYKPMGNCIVKKGKFRYVLLEETDKNAVIRRIMPD